VRVPGSLFPLAAGIALLGCLLAPGCADASGPGPASGSIPSAPHAPRRPPLPAEPRPAARALEERRFEEARSLIRSYREAHPDDDQAAFLLWLRYAWTENWGAARPWLEKALERAPDFDLAHEPLAHALLMLGELEGARREYGLCVALVPDDPKGHYGLGLVELEETRLAEAAACFRRALACFEALESMDPRQAAARANERAECHARLGEVLFAQADYAAARTELSRATELWPGNISAYYTLSLVHRRLGEDALAEKAAAHYESARRELIEHQAAGQR